MEDGQGFGLRLGIGLRLHPVALDPMRPERLRVERRWLVVVGAVLAYTVVAWTMR